MKWRLAQLHDKLKSIDKDEELYYSYHNSKLLLRLDMVKEFIKGLLCVILDHKYEDNSYGNPETGCIDLTCIRCGLNHHTTLY